MAPTRASLRWLLRLVGAPELLRLILEEQRGRTLPYCVGFTWELLHPRGDWTEQGKNDATELLKTWGVLAEPGPARAWAQMVNHLRALPDPAELMDLARYCSLPNLFHDRACKDPSAVSGLSELHAHLRGSVPWEHLWERWVTDARARAATRCPEHRIEATGATWTWAELLHHAATLISSLGSSRHESARKLTAEFLQDVCAAGHKTRLFRVGIPLLAIATTLRAQALYRRGDDDGRAGLQSFQEAYHRYSKAQKSPRSDSAETASLSTAILNRFWDQGVQVLELRPTLERRPIDLARRLYAILRGYMAHLRERKNSTLSLGIVPSLFKQERVGRGPDIASRRIALWEAQVDGLLELLEVDPLLRWFVVGLDAAGGERGCPPRLLSRPFSRLEAWHRAHGAPPRPGAPSLVKYLRQTMGVGTSQMNTQDLAHLDLQRLAAEIRSNPVLYPGWPRLGRTVHVGEDFVDPMTGLRHIDEAMRALTLGAGDRLGHALAAGLDEDGLRAALDRRAEVRRLSDGSWEIRKPVGEHALDLSWMATQLESGDRAWALAELSRALTLSWSQPSMARALLSHLTHTDASVELPGALYDHAAEADACIVVHLDHAWETRFHQARRRVLAEISARGLVVESCPTSNIAVANLSTPPAHVLLRELGPSRVAICTDDAGLFGAWPQAEMRLGLPPEDAAMREAIILGARQASFIQTS